MSAAVIDRPATAAKNAVKAVAFQAKAPSIIAPVAASSSEDLDFRDIATEKLSVAAAITSVCINAVGGDHPKTCQSIPMLVRYSMKHVAYLLVTVDGTKWASDVGPGFDQRFNEVCTLVDLFNEFCVRDGRTGASEFKFCEEVTCNMLWGIDTALQMALKCVNPPGFPEGEIA